MIIVIGITLCILVNQFMIKNILDEVLKNQKTLLEDIRQIKIELTDSKIGGEHVL